MENKLEGVFLAAKRRADKGPEPRRTGDLAPSKLDYGIFITPRSGSTFLTHAIRDTGVLGVPDEWFNHGSIAPLVARLGVDNVADYIFSIRRTLQTPNGVFGFQISWPQFAFLRQLVDVRQTFGPELKWLFLRRKNIVAQGVSLVIANQTGVFHSYQLTSGSGDDFANQVAYDADQLAATIRMIHNQELAIRRYFAEQDVRPIALFYEQIVAEPWSALTAMRASLGVVEQPRAGSSNPLRKLATSLNTELEQRFRRDHAGFLAELEQSRREADPALA